MTNEKWTELTVLDPLSRFSRNLLGVYLRGKKDDQIDEIFVSGADGTKVAFLGKTSFGHTRTKDNIRSR